MRDAAAFFDVDDTLTRVNGMHAFLTTFRPGTIHPDIFRERVAELLALHAGGANREAVSTHYFRLFEGERREHVLTEGRRWAKPLLGREGFYIRPVLARLRAHQKSGHPIVLISGSFEPLIQPVACHVGADLVYCTNTNDRAGILDGTTRGTMVGQNKAEAVAEACELLQVEPAHCYAYGDHISDLPMLTAVGNPVIVTGPAADPALASYAAGWERLHNSG